MTNIEIQNSIIRSISQLSLPQQLKLLDFIKSLLVKKQDGKPEGLLKFAGAFSKEDLEEMEKALEDCEQIDEDEW
jgi:flagellar biosynthesis/type III secretory pathway ATPase